MNSKSGARQLDLAQELYSLQGATNLYRFRWFVVRYSNSNRLASDANIQIGERYLKRRGVLAYGEVCPL